MRVRVRVRVGARTKEMLRMGVQVRVRVLNDRKNIRIGKIAKIGMILICVPVISKHSMIVWLEISEF